MAGLYTRGDKSAVAFPTTRGSGSSNVPIVIWENIRDVIVCAVLGTYLVVPAMSGSNPTGNACSSPKQWRCDNCKRVLLAPEERTGDREHSRGAYDPECRLQTRLAHEETTGDSLRTTMKLTPMAVPDKPVAIHAQHIAKTTTDAWLIFKSLLSDALGLM